MHATRLAGVLPLVLAAAGWTRAAAQAFPTGSYQARGIVIRVEADQRFEINSPRAGLLSAGHLTSEAPDLVTIHEERGRVACVRMPGQYRWRLADDTLRLVAVDDPCDGRRGALSGAWLRLRPALALTGATLFDGTGSPARPGMTIVMRDERIAAVFPDGAETLPDDAQVRAVAGRWVMPGLIDAHVHLATDPSGPDRRDAVERRLAAALRGGVVAVRDMAGDTRVLVGLARDALVGDLDAPRISYAAIFAGPEFFRDPRVQASSAGVTIGTAPWARAVTDATDLPQAVAEAKGTGASAIKLYAALDSRLAARVIAEAHRQGLRVWAHATLFPARPSGLARAGADVLSHALYLTWEAAESLPTYEHRSQVRTEVSPDDPAFRRLFATMVERHVMLDPTLWVNQLSLGADSSPVNRRRADLAAALTRAAHRAGVAIVTGTDNLSGSSGLPHVHDEMALLVSEAGLSPIEALVAATANAARAAGLEASHGTVAVGKAADLLVLDADPAADIRNTRRIGFVVRRGRVVAP